MCPMARSLGSFFLEVFSLLQSAPKIWVNEWRVDPFHLMWKEVEGHNY